MNAVSEIEIKPCYFDPFFFPSFSSDVCAPSTSKEQDATKGKWVQVDRNLNFQGLTYLVNGLSHLRYRLTLNVAAEHLLSTHPSS